MRTPDRKRKPPSSSAAGRDRRVGGVRASGRSGGVVHAPGKRHRRAPAPVRGIKHSDETIAKALAAARTRRAGMRE